MNEEKQTMSSIEQARKDRVRLRLFVLLVIFDIALVAYLAFELITIITTK